MSLRRLTAIAAGGRERRLVGALSGTTILLWVGASAVLPLLPSYLRKEGSSNALVGVIMAAYFAASVLTQYPIGRLSDGIGRRPVVLSGLVLFSGASVGFALSSAPGWAILFRALQGVGAGAVTVASAAAIGTLVAPAERGAAFGALYGSQMLALAGGPLVGSIVGGSSMRILFLVAAGAALVAAGPVLAVLPAGRATLAAGGGPDGLARPRARGSPPERSPGVRRHRPRLVGPAYLGVLLAFGAAGWFGGTYETCWTLLLRLRHAANYEIGLSWTLFALPFAALSVPAGRLASRLDRRAMAVGAVLWTAGFCVSYPFLHSVPLLVGLGCLEAMGTVLGAPPALLILSEHTPVARQGEAQGAVETARTAATAVAAALAGVLFGLDPIIPFALAGGLGLAAALVVLVAWRGISGRQVRLAGAVAIEAALLAAERGSGAPESPARGAGALGSPLPDPQS